MSIFSLVSLTVDLADTSRRAFCVNNWYSIVNQLCCNNFFFFFKRTFCLVLSVLGPELKVLIEFCQVALVSVTVTSKFRYQDKSSNNFRVFL